MGVLDATHDNPVFRDHPQGWLRIIRPGLTEATQVLTQLTGRPFRLVNARVVSGADPAGRLGEREGAALYLGVLGRRPVDVVLWFPREFAMTLVQSLIPPPVGWPLSDLSESALVELANVVFTAFLNVVADTLRESWPVTPPRLLERGERDRWLQAARTHGAALTVEAGWTVDGEPGDAVLVLSDHLSPAKTPADPDSSDASWDWVNPDQWNKVLDTGVWYPIVMRWAHRWANRFNDGHWPQVVVQTLPATVASLWRVINSQEAEVLAAKGYRLMPGQRVAITDPRYNLVAAAYHGRVPVAYPHHQVLPFMRHLTEARRVLAIPLATPDGVAGVLTVGEIDPRQWSDGFVQVLQEFSPLLAQALVQHVRVAELERHADLFRWMNRVVGTVWDPQTGYRVRPGDVEAPPGILRPWRKEWPRLAGIHGGLWVFWDEGRERWRIIDAWGPWTFRTRELYTAWWPRIRRWLLSGDSDCRTRGWRMPPHPAAVGDMPVFWYPIREGEHVIGGGVLWIPDPTVGEGGVLDSLLDVVGMALVAMRRQRQLTRQSLRDPLTNALNRRGLERLMDDLLSAEPPRTLLFCLVDLDHFKPVNDTWGHAVGDQLLADWAHFARQSLRAADWVARMGGDEFVVVFVDAMWSSAVQSRLARLVEAGPLTRYGASATVGVVEMPREARTFADAYRLADQRLYDGKQQGRGRIIGPGQPLGEG